MRSCLTMQARSGKPLNPPFRGGGGGVTGADRLGLVPGLGLELPELPLPPFVAPRRLLAAEIGRSCCGEGAALQNQKISGLTVLTRPQTAGVARKAVLAVAI